MSQQNSFSQNTNRIDILDALRGFSLMGLFLVHMVEYYAMYHLNPEESLGHDVIYFFFSGKAFATFAFLFGISFFIIMNNQAKNGVDFRPRFCWRMLLLLGFGWLHGLMYFGDVLSSLAVTGVLVVSLYKVKTRYILLLSAIFLLQLPTLTYLAFHLLTQTPVTDQLMGIQYMGPAYEQFINGNLFDVFHVNLWKTQLGILLYGFQGCRGSVILGMVLLGFAAARLNLITQVYQLKKQLIYLVIVSLIFGCVFYILLTYVEQNKLPDMGQFYLENSVKSIMNVFFSLSGIGLFTLAYQIQIGEKIVAVLKPAGRMTLTLYIAQSYICVPIFYSFGFGGYKTLGQTNAILLGVILWGIQLIFAHLWLKHHRYGPLEFVWRKLTYLKFPQKKGVT